MPHDCKAARRSRSFGALRLYFDLGSNVCTSIITATHAGATHVRSDLAWHISLHATQSYLSRLGSSMLYQGLCAARWL